jgi:uncharacterized protein (TIGR02001 family)
MITAAVVVAALPTPVLPTSEVTDQASGPRPNRDPDAIPDGRPPASSSSGSSLSFTISAVSDYRLRGISQSDGKPALQASAEAAAASGIYAGVWSSTIAAYEGAHSEVDIYGGYRTKAGGFDLDGGIISYFYPGADGVSSAEIYASGAHAVGTGSTKLGASYTPHQNELGQGDGVYLFAEGETPVPHIPVTLRGHIGYEAGVNTTTGADKVDWLLGADLRRGPATLSIAWVAARYQQRIHQEDHRDRVVMAVSVAF